MKSNTQLTTKDLLVACQNAQSESVNSLVIQHNGVNLPVINAAVVPNRNHSDLVLFVGAAPKEAVLSGAKPNKTPTNKEITPVVIAAIEQLFHGSDITTKSLLEIKKALAVVSEHFEELSDAQNPLNSNNNGFGGAL